MYNEMKEFSELENPAQIDFTDTEHWAWGFSENEGYIYHYPNDNSHDDPMYCIAYKVPPFMATMITNVRDGALNRLKLKLVSLEREKAKLLSLEEVGKHRAN